MTDTVIKRCENCGLPSWAVDGPGLTITVEDKPENRFQKTRKRTAWCHSDECAVQALGISRYGRETSKWPVTLAQFRAMNPLKPAADPKPEKRARASKKAKSLVWGSKPTPTAKNASAKGLESIG